MITGTLYEDKYKFLIISRSVLFRMRSVSEKNCRENQNKHFGSSNFFFDNRAVYEIMWKSIVEQARPTMTVWRMRIVCWITKVINTDSEYVMLISYFNCCKNAPQCYVIRTLPVLFSPDHRKNIRMNLICPAILISA